MENLSNHPPRPKRPHGSRAPVLSVLFCTVIAALSLLPLVFAQNPPEPSWARPAGAEVEAPTPVDLPGTDYLFDETPVPQAIGSAPDSPTSKQQPDAPEQRYAGEIPLNDEGERLRDQLDATIRAEAVLLINADTDEVLYAKNIHEQHEPASTTKLLTALLAYELKGIDGNVLITEEDTKVEPSHVPLIPGETVPVRDLIYSTLIGSDNDSAIALGRHAAGELDLFMDMMNRYAEALGCQNTIFQNPNGLPATPQFTTAADLMIIFEQVLERPELARICQMKNFTLKTRAKTQLVKNHNKLLGTYEGMGPAKTGWTRASKHTYAAQVERDGITIRLTLLKSPNKWVDSRALFDFAFEVTEPEPVETGLFAAANEVEKEIKAKYPGATPTETQRLKALRSRSGNIVDDPKIMLDQDDLNAAELAEIGFAEVPNQDNRSALQLQAEASMQRAAAGQKEYEIRRGDTLEKIARRHGTSTEDIVELNDIENPDRIWPGQIIMVPTE